MRLALFIPCYIDQFYPQVGLATVAVLERFGVEFEYPVEQTCCGQPMANTGCVDDAAGLARRYLEIFGKFDAVVCPSGSCAAMVRRHFSHLPGVDVDPEGIASRTYELCEFLVDVQKVDPIDGRFPHRVGLHSSCHGLRELRLGSASELMSESDDKARRLLDGLEGLELTELERRDECCGFGGTFAVTEDAVSCRMGLDRIADHEQAQSEILTAVDMSCLMHLDGLIRRNAKPLRVMHISEVLAEALG